MKDRRVWADVMKPDAVLNFSLIWNEIVQVHSSVPEWHYWKDVDWDKMEKQTDKQINKIRKRNGKTDERNRKRY
jgi:hypothetical protein